MATVVNPTARRETVQPSLWDRLVDDLPGLVAETSSLQDELAQQMSSTDLEACLQGGAREIERRDALSDDIKRKLHFLVSRLQAKQHLQRRGIVVTADVLREAVRRDIEALFNIERLEAQYLLTDQEGENFESPADLLANFPEVRSSVLNYGVPSFSGHSRTDFDKVGLEKDLQNLLGVYEPRLKKGSIKVTVVTDKKLGMRIEIDGILMLSPVHERLRLSTTIDLDNGFATTSVEET